MLSALAVSLVFALPGPSGTFSDAALDLAEHTAPESRCYVRYLSLYNVPAADRPAVAAACRFWVNSLSRRKGMVALPDLADGTLLKLDLRALEWDAQSRREAIARAREAGVELAGKVSLDPWETLVKKDVYFKVTSKIPVRQPTRDAYGRTVYPGEYKIARGWLDPVVELSARTLSHSTLFVVRADWFLVQTGFDRNKIAGRIDGLYSDFLMLPDSEADLLKVLLVDEKGIGRETLASGGAVIRSQVALHNRVLELLPSLTGPPGGQFYWRTYDTKSNVADQSVLANFVGKDGFSAVREDGGEVIFTLPNGLHGYYLKNADGKQVGEVPIEIAARKGHPNDPVVFNAYACVSCHVRGINDIADVVAPLALHPEVGLAAVGAYKARDVADRERRRVEEYYLTALAEAVKGHQGGYAAAVKRSNGLEAVANADGFVRAVERYQYDLVDLGTAAGEMGMAAEEARAVLRDSGEPEALAVAAGTAIARDSWESAYEEVMTSRRYTWEDHP